jgi:hypothetical protein
VEPADVIARLCAEPGRGACTDAERRAAVWLRDELPAARLEPHWVRPRRELALALAALLAAAGSLASVQWPVAGFAAAALATACLALDARSPLLLLTRRRATQHVLLAPAGEGIPLELRARYDAPRRGLVLNDRWRARLPGRAADWLAGSAAVVAATAAARHQGVDAAWLGAIQLVPTIVLIAAVAAALDVATSEFSPGADTASAAAVAIAVFEELAAEPPSALSPSLVLLGGGARRRPPEGAVVIEIGACTGGTPAWRTRHPQLAAAAARAAAALSLPDRSGAGGGRRPWLYIGCVDDRGIVARSHQPDDTPERADLAAADRTIDLALGTVDALDPELRATLSPA